MAIDARFSLLLLGATAAGLGALRLVAPGRSDLLLAAAAGAGFAAILAIAGFEAVRRAAARSADRGVQLFLAVMTAKVLAFAAFLLTIALTTDLNPAALASGLAGATLLGEALAIEGLRRIGTGAAGRPGAGAVPGERAGPAPAPNGAAGGGRRELNGT